MRIRFGWLEYAGFLLLGFFGALLSVAGVQSGEWFLMTLGGLFSILFVALLILAVLPRLRSGPAAHIAAPTPHRGTLVSFTPLGARWPTVAVICVAVFLAPVSVLITGVPPVLALLVSLGLAITLIGSAVAVVRRVGSAQIALSSDHVTIGGLRNHDVPWDEVLAVSADPTDNRVHVRTSVGTEVITLAAPPLDVVAVMALPLTYASEAERRAVLGTPDAPTDIAAIIEDRQLASDVVRQLERAG